MDNHEAIQSLMQLGGATMTIDFVKDLLTKHKGNADAAAAEILDGGVEERTVTSISHEEGIIRPVEARDAPGQPAKYPNVIGALNAMDHQPLQPKPWQDGKNSQHVIDLTGDTESSDLERAMAASLMQEPRQTTNSLHNPSTALVPYNPGGLVTSHDDDLNRALEASYNSSMTTDVYDEPPLEQQLRQAERPIALRTTSPANVHVALLLQLMCHLPSFRAYLKRLPQDLEACATEPEATALRCFQTLFAKVDLTQRSYLNIDETLAILGLSDAQTGREPGDLIKTLYAEIAALSGRILREGQSRLFMMSGGSVDRPAESVDVWLIELNVCSSEDYTIDLQRFLTHTWGENHRVLTHLPENLAVHLNRPTDNHVSIGPAPPPKQPFTFPSQLYLDQYLMSNYLVAKDKRAEHAHSVDRMNKLTELKINLTRYDGNDSIKHLKASLHYFEDLSNTADAVAIRKHLRSIIDELEQRIAEIDKEAVSLTSHVANIFAVPEFQQHGYDLCGVIHHDGLFGRQHLYSYVKAGGKWWKTVDHTVTEVSEDAVFSDSAGLHLGAGPVFLLYTRKPANAADFDATPWPIDSKTIVKQDNLAFRDSLTPELARILVPDSPVSASPETFTTPSESRSVVGGDTDVDEVMEIERQ